MDKAKFVFSLINTTGGGKSGFTILLLEMNWSPIDFIAKTEEFSSSLSVHAVTEM